MIPPEEVWELDVQLDCPPPAPDTKLPCAPLGLTLEAPLTVAAVTPLADEVDVRLGEELLAAFEVTAQPPELPLTPDCVVVWCVLEEALQLNAFAILGMFVVRKVAATKTTIPLMNNNLFMFVIILVAINIICQNIL